jgi:hypothetical protein
MASTGIIVVTSGVAVMLAPGDHFAMPS